MKGPRDSLWRVLAWSVAAIGLIWGFVQSQTKTVRIVIETESGSIEAEIDPVHAPATAANFLRYVNGGFYSGGQFHRAVKPDNQPNNNVKIEVIQASINSARSKDGFPAIPLERTSTTGLFHKDGTISMARGGPDSATSDFFICIGDQPSLDFGGARNPDGQGFAAFGKVTKGMDIVRKIQAAPTNKPPGNAQTLNPPIKIIAIRHLS